MFDYHKSVASIDPFAISLLGVAFLVIGLVFNALTGSGFFFKIGFLLIGLRFFSAIRKKSLDELLRGVKAISVGKTLFGFPYHKQHGMKY